MAAACASFSRRPHVCHWQANTQCPVLLRRPRVALRLVSLTPLSLLLLHDAAAPDSSAPHINGQQRLACWVG